MSTSDKDVGSELSQVEVKGGKTKEEGETEASGAVVGESPKGEGEGEGQAEEGEGSGSADQGSPAAPAVSTEQGIKEKGMAEGPPPVSSFEETEQKAKELQMRLEFEQELDVLKGRMAGGKARVTEAECHAEVAASELKTRELELVQSRKATAAAEAALESAQRSMTEWTDQVRKRRQDHQGMSKRRRELTAELSKVQEVVVDQEGVKGGKVQESGEGPSMEEFQALQAKFPEDTIDQLAKRYEAQRKFALFQKACAGGEGSLSGKEGGVDVMPPGPFGGQQPSREGYVGDEFGPADGVRVCGFDKSVQPVVPSAVKEVSPPDEKVVPSQAEQVESSQVRTVVAPVRKVVSSAGVVVSSPVRKVVSGPAGFVVSSPGSSSSGGSRGSRRDRGGGWGRSGGRGGGWYGGRGGGWSGGQGGDWSGGRGGGGRGGGNGYRQGFGGFPQMHGGRGGGHGNFEGHGAMQGGFGVQRNYGFQGGAQGRGPPPQFSHYHGGHRGYRRR
eukprot:g15642.t1